MSLILLGLGFFSFVITDLVTLIVLTQIDLNALFGPIRDAVNQFLGVV
ncbi:MAG: hypothetical protein L6Q92_11390 [Phycisphaerae bacterium]|nr:hypothetical protein [Phycisphaerae bacterium]